MNVFVVWVALLLTSTIAVSIAVDLIQWVRCGRHGASQHGTPER